MSFRYIGSKARLVDQISQFIPEPSKEGFFVDAFCGTGSVAEIAALKGWNIRLNDNLLSAVITAHARLISDDEVPFLSLGGYDNAIQILNNLNPSPAFIWRTYSPASLSKCGIERRYFTEINAQRIDAIREKIYEWSEDNLITEIEKKLLIADLFSALNKVANIAGTFGCFMANWTKQSEGDLYLVPRKLKRQRVNVEVSVGDVFDVPNSYQDVVYLDPPYTKRQYASYYHILETIAWWDSPQVDGVAGLRPWKDKASDFCYKVRALKTLSRLIQSLKAQTILLSYSSEGHIPMCEMEEELRTLGQKTNVIPLGKIGRYRPNKIASESASEVNEYLIHLNNELEVSRNS